MEFGQILHNNPVAMECESFHRALLNEIRRELNRVYRNVNQKQWAGSPNYDPWSDEKAEYRPLPPGIEWNPYYNWGGSPDNPDWDQAEANKPNFSFEGVEFRWYKRFGRSLNVNVCWSADKWVRWYQRVMQTISAYEDENTSYNHGDPSPYPSPDDIVPMDVTPDDLRHMELMQKVATLEAQINCIACVCIDVADKEMPQADPEDWRWCQALEWVTKLGVHALNAPGEFKIHDGETE
jgi:hypothetical protein